MEEHIEKQEEEETRTPGCARAARESDFAAVAALAFYRAEGFSAQQQRLELPLSGAGGRPESR